ncbi:hypothetical protein KCP77_03230 [Salmonella enterica subsp. enterica]|nr:hypothetical protein KCP77_03230 [Salmonella enterica subsp. enterica]
MVEVRLKLNRRRRVLLMALIRRVIRNRSIELFQCIEYGEEACAPTLKMAHKILTYWSQTSDGRVKTVLSKSFLVAPIFSATAKPQHFIHAEAIPIPQFSGPTQTQLHTARLEWCVVTAVYIKVNDDL